MALYVSTRGVEGFSEPNIQRERQASEDARRPQNARHAVASCELLVFVEGSHHTCLRLHNRRDHARTLYRRV